MAKLKLMHIITVLIIKIIFKLNMKYDLQFCLTNKPLNKFND